MSAELDTSLPSYDSDISAKITALSPSQILQLHDLWLGLHEAWGEPPADHPLGFLVHGGTPQPALDDGERSSGRYFDPAAVGRIVDALDDASIAITPGLARRVFKRARTANPEVQEAFLKVATFLRETRARGRGMIVHLFV
jgi:hypothetical protein